MFNLSILRETRPIQNNSAIYRHDSKWKNEKNPSGKLFVFKANCSRPVGSAMPTTLKNLDGLKRGALARQSHQGIETHPTTKHSINTRNSLTLKRLRWFLRQGLHGVGLGRTYSGTASEISIIGNSRDSGRRRRRRRWD